MKTSREQTKNAKEIAKSAHALISKMVTAEQIVTDDFDYDETRLNEIGAIGELNGNIAEAVAGVVGTVKEADHSYEIIDSEVIVGQYYPLYAAVAICYELGHYTEFHEIQTVSKDITDTYYHMFNPDGSINYKLIDADISYMTGLISGLVNDYLQDVCIKDTFLFMYRVINELNEITGGWFEEARLMWHVPQIENDPCPICGNLMKEIDREEYSPTADDPGYVSVTWRCTVCDEIFDE